MTETETKWTDRLREWQDSGKGAAEFAAGKPYKASTLKWWRTELRRRSEEGARGRGRTKSIPMARVVRRVDERVAPTKPAEDGGVVVEISGARIAVTRGSDMELFAEVVRALSRAQ